MNRRGGFGHCKAYCVGGAGLIGCNRGWANTADRGLAPAVVSAVVARVAIPELTVTGAPIATPPLLKVTVPAAAAGETVAVRITLAPEGAVVTAVPGADANAADSVVLVVSPSLQEP